MKRKRITILMIITAIALTAVGLAHGQHSEVMNKAIMICLECVGIG